MGTEIDKIIDAVIKAEGGSKATNDPVDKGGRTQYGISEKSNPEAWADDKVTEEEARAIYRNKYLDGPGFSRLLDHRLQRFLVDWGVISGPDIVIKYLQRAIGVKDDGVIGDKTTERANSLDAGVLVNKLIDERIKMMCRIVQKTPSQLKYLMGWVNRALEFRA